MAEMYIVVSYDIPDDRRRTRVHKTLRNFGEWVQYSLFECRLREEDLLRLVDQVGRLIDAGTDRVCLYRLCADCQRLVQRIGSDDPYNPEAMIV